MSHRIITLFFSVMVNVIEYWILILLMQYVCSARIHLTPKKRILCTIFTAACYTVAYLVQSGSMEMFFMPLIIGLTVFFYSSRRFKDLLLFFPALSFYLLFTVMPEAILTELHPAFAQRISISGDTFTYTAFLTDIILLVVLLLLQRILTKYETTLPFSGKELMGCIGLLFFSFIDIALLMGLNYAEMVPLYYYVWVIIFVGAFLLSIGYYLYNLVDIRVQFYRQTLSKNDTEYLKLQLAELQRSKKQDNQLKQMRHDLKNHIDIINTLCQQEKYEELKEYTASLNEEAHSRNNIILSGNEIADIVLQSKAALAEKHNISFQFKGNLETLNQMEAPDICGLLANAYDNAIEACKNIENAYIHTDTSTTSNYTVIRIANPILHKVKIHNNHISTTKKDKRNHGYGLEIMQRITRKYGGKLVAECTDNEFYIKITLLNNQAPVST